MKKKKAAICIYKLYVCTKKVYDFESMDKDAIYISVLGVYPFFGVVLYPIASKNLSLEEGIGVPSIGLGIKVVPSGI
jgi:hypothetical protein